MQPGLHGRARKKIDEENKTYMAIFLSIIFVAVGVAGFAFGFNVGAEMRTNKYDLILNAEDTEILFETLDELVSRQVVNEK